MHQPITIAPLTTDQLAELRQRYDATAAANLRLRYQMVLLAHQGRAVAEIASIVLRSREEVARVLKRFLRGGLDAVPRDYPPGMTPTVTAAWEAELLRVIELDPQQLGLSSANWTTALLATYLAEVTGLAVSAETVRLRLHALGYVCKRPTWTVGRKAEDQPAYLGNA